MATTKPLQRLLVVLFIGFGWGGLPPRPVQCADTFPNFVVMLTDDQSWVGSSIAMDPATRGPRVAGDRTGTFTKRPCFPMSKWTWFDQENRSANLG